MLARGAGALIGMVHLPPLPGAPRYDGDVRRVVEAARSDVGSLVEAGFDGVLFVNEGDAPYLAEAPPAGVAAMAAVVAEARAEGVGFGVEFLFDAAASLSIAVATGASFIRGGLLGAWEGTSGWRLGDAAGLARLRAALRAESVALVTTAEAELAAPVSGTGRAERLAIAALEGAFDAVAVGGLPGAPVDGAAAAAIRDAVGQRPVMANSGVRPETVAALLESFDGCFVGSAVKRDGLLHERVDPARARALVRAARG